VDARLKQRVVGAFVLTALAIIILPMLLDGSAEDRARVIANIPEPLKIEMTRMSVQDIRDQMERSEQASAAALPTETVDEDSYDDVEIDFGLDKNKLPVSWSLQLGSFQKKDNALKLRAQLRAAEYHSYILYGKTSIGETWRVFVGPMLKKSALQSIASKIETSFSLKGQVVRYRIEDDADQLGG
jgi:DedD protein